MWIPLLLASPSPCLRLLVLRDLLDNPDEDEIHELQRLQEKDPLAVTMLKLQNPDGSWGRSEAVGLLQSSTVLNTSQALARLGYLGFESTHPAVRRGADYLFSLQREDGSWSSPDDLEREDSSKNKPEIKGKKGRKLRTNNEKDSEYVITPLQTALPLRGLAFCGHATDERAEKAYDWLIDKKLPDGGWPTRVTEDGSYGYRAGYRALPHSRWGCRSNTTGVLQCLALHPERQHRKEAHRALDLLLARETRDVHTLGFEAARMIGAEPAHGFLTFFARFDLSLILDLCWRIGATLSDQRVADLVEFVKGLQGEYGLWEYQKPHASQWVTFDLIRSLSQLDTEGDWVSAEPRTPFEGYPRVEKRY